MQILIETVFFGQSVPGYPSLVVGLMVLGGVQLIMIGIMGEYIGKILSELKRGRPISWPSTLKAAEDAAAAADPPALGGGIAGERRAIFPMLQPQDTQFG